jgi:hypothetical protein
MIPLAAVLLVLMAAKLAAIYWAIDGKSQGRESAFVVGARVPYLTPSRSCR